MVITGLEHRATIFPRIIAGGNYSKEATTATTTTIPLFEGNNIQGRQLFQILLMITEVVPQFIFFYYTIK